VTLGQYVAGNSVAHRLDARTKILMALAFMVLLLVGHGLWALGACCAFAVAWLLVSRVPLSALWRSNRGIVGLILLTIALDVLLGPTAPAGATSAGWHLGPLLITARGAAEGLAAGLRLGLLVLQSALITLTTAPLDLVAGAERLLRPLRRIGVPAHELALMAGLALRFIPALAEEAQRIALAQAARGADLQAPGRARLRALISLLIPLLLSVFRRADQLALAMEARGYRGEEGRTRWRQPHFRQVDAVAAALVVALAACVLLTSWAR